MVHFLKAISFILGLMLTACASVKTIPENSLAEVKRLGVLSTVASNHLHRKHVGITVFGNENEHHTITDWRLDSEYDDQLVSAAKSVLALDAIKLNSNRARLLETLPSSKILDLSNVAQELTKACKESSLDAVLFATASRGVDPSSSNQTLDGVGIFTRQFFHVIHVSGRMHYFNCKTGEIQSSVELYYTRNGYHTGALMMQIPSSMRNRKVSELTASEISDIRSKLTEMPRAAWADSLRVMVGK